MLSDGGKLIAVSSIFESKFAKNHFNHGGKRDAINLNTDSYLRSLAVLSWRWINFADDV